MTMQNITLSPERRAEILQQLHPRRTKLRWTTGRMVLAAVLAALLTFSAFAAAIPAIRAALQNALGSFTEQSQPITGIAVEDNGIEVRPVAALSDNSITCVYVEIQDKTGDRLNGDYDVQIEIDHPLDDAPVHLGTISDRVGYDAQTHTALYRACRPGSVAAEHPTATVKVWLLNPQAETEHQSIGFWSVDVDLERVAERLFVPTDTVNNYRLFEVRVSEISLSMLIENNVTDPTQADYNPIDYARTPISLTLRDGTLIDCTRHEQNRLLAVDMPPSADPIEDYERFYRSEIEWMLDTPIDPDEVATITIDDTVVSLQ